MTYEEAVANHEWHVPERYNIAEDVATSTARQARDDPRALRRHGARGEAGASCRSCRTASPTCCAAPASSKGDRVAMLLPPTPETAAAFFGTWKTRRDPAVDVGALRRRRHPSPRGTRRRRCSSPTRPTGTASIRRWSSTCSYSTTISGRRPPDFEPEDTLADDPAQLYYTSGTTGLAKGIVHAHRYLLAHEEFIYCHDVQDGERFHGMGEWAWAAGIAPLLGPWRFGAVQLVYQREGGFDPHKQLDFLSRHQASNVFTTPTAMRSMMAIGDAGTALPAAVPRSSAARASR